MQAEGQGFESPCLHQILRVQVFCLYILRSDKTGRYYVGSTGDLQDRLRRHNSGYSKATKAGVPWQLVYKEQFASKSEACIRELEIKAWKSRVIIEGLIKTQHGERSD